MLIGLLMCLTISIFVVSGVVVLANFSTVLHNSITAAAIGNTSIYSYSIALLALSALILFILVLLLKRKTK